MGKLLNLQAVVAEEPYGVTLLVRIPARASAATGRGYSTASSKSSPGGRTGTQIAQRNYAGGPLRTVCVPRGLAKAPLSELQFAPGSTTGSFSRAASEKYCQGRAGRGASGAIVEIENGIAVGGTSRVGEPSRPVGEGSLFARLQAEHAD